MPTPILNIVERIINADRLYHNGFEPDISDAVYDALKAELLRRAPDHPLLTRVGAPPDSNRLQKRDHTFPLGSLENTFTAAEIAGYITKTNAALNKLGKPSVYDWIVQPKLDGLSLGLEYRDGKLVYAITRGDGTTGEDVTHSAYETTSVRRVLPVKMSCQVYGEALLRADVFKKFFSSYSNARNAAAGTLRRLDSDGAEHLSFYAYGFRPLDEAAKRWVVNHGVISEGGIILGLRSLGFLAPKIQYIGTKTTDSPHQAIVKAWSDGLETRDKLPYGVDGLVLKIDKRDLSEALGMRNGCPCGQVAMKWRGQMVAKTWVVGINIGVGRSGKLTPVAVLKPVECGGVTVSTASMFNWDEVAHLGVGCEAEALIEREGDVIPRVKAVLTPPAVVFARPTVCPCCARPTVSKGPEEYCVNPDCGQRLFRDVMNWINQRNILGFGETIVDKLMALDGPLQRIDDLYRLGMDQLIDACGSPLTARKLLQALEKSKDVTLTELCGGIGIPKLQETGAGKIITQLDIRSLEDFIALGNDVTRLRTVATFADTKAKIVANGIRVNAGLLRSLNKLLKVKASVNGPLTGISFCITGATSIGRDELERMIKGAGGVFKTSVTNDTTYLVMAELGSGSTKEQAAMKKGVKCITEEQLLVMIDGK